MKKIDFPVGISDFSKIRENEYYYIDKTGLICEVLKKPWNRSDTDYTSETFWKDPWNEYAS